jgi:hypothetical protein
MPISPVGSSTNAHIPLISQASNGQPSQSTGGVSSASSSLHRMENSEDYDMDSCSGRCKALGDYFFSVPRNPIEFIFGSERSFNHAWSCFAGMVMRCFPRERDNFFLFMCLLFPFKLAMASVSFVLLPIRIPCMIVGLIKQKC